MSNDSGNRDPQFEILRIEIMGTDRTLTLSPTLAATNPHLWLMNLIGK